MAVTEGTRWAVDGDHERLLQFTPADLPTTVPPPILPYPNPCPAYQPDIRYKLWFADLRTYAQFHTASQLVLHYHAQHVSYDASTAMSKYDHDHHNLEDDVGGQGLVELCSTVATSQVQSFSLCLGEQIHGLASMLSADVLDSAFKALLPPRQSSTSRLTDLLVDLYALQHLPPLFAYLPHSGITSLQLVGYNTFIGTPHFRYDYIYAKLNPLAEGWFQRLCDGLATCHNLESLTLQSFRPFALDRDDQLVEDTGQQVATTLVDTFSKMQSLTSLKLSETSRTLLELLAQWLECSTCRLTSLTLSLDWCWFSYGEDCPELDKLLLALNRNGSIVNFDILNYESSVLPQLSDRQRADIGTLQQKLSRRQDASDTQTHSRKRKAIAIDNQ